MFLESIVRRFEVVAMFPVDSLVLPITGHDESARQTEVFLWNLQAMSRICFFGNCSTRGSFLLESNLQSTAAPVKRKKEMLEKHLEKLKNDGNTIHSKCRRGSWSYTGVVVRCWRLFCQFIFSEVGWFCTHRGILVHNNETDCLLLRPTRWDQQLRISGSRNLSFSEKYQSQPFTFYWCS